MHSVNHAAVGMSIALVLPPAAALPLAFASHFMLDALPHFGIKGNEGFKALFRLKTTFFMMAVDLIGLILLVFIARGESWHVWVAMVLAVSPDFAWIYRYFFFELENKRPPKPNILTHFHISIQWCERQWGIFIEIAIATVLISILWSRM